MTDASQTTIAERLRKIVADKIATDPPAIADDADLFDDLGLDSLDMVDIEISIEREFRIEIGADETHARTLGQLTAFIEKRLG